MNKIVDAISTVDTLLTANWTPGNTDSLTPEIKPIVESKQENYPNGDFVLLYEVDQSVLPFGLGANAWELVATLSIDCRTTFKRAAFTDVRPHAVKMKDEVLRIISTQANVIAPGDDFNLILPLRIKDLSDKTKGFGRFVIDAVLTKWGDLT